MSTSETVTTIDPLRAAITRAEEALDCKEWIRLHRKLWRHDDWDNPARRPQFISVPRAFQDALDRYTEKANMALWPNRIFNDGPWKFRGIPIVVVEKS